MTHLAILGASGHGKVIADTAALDSKWKKISFFDDAWPELADVAPWPIIGNTEMLLNNLRQFSGVIIGIGNNNIRQEKHELLADHFAPFTTIIHPLAYISPHSCIGLGSVVFAQAAINIHSNLGLSCIINTAATVDHDSSIGDYVHISPGANLGGNVRVARCSWVGLGSSVRQGIEIGSNVIIGAGSTVVKNVSDDQTIVGSPAVNLTSTST